MGSFDTFYSLYTPSIFPTQQVWPGFAFYDLHTAFNEWFVAFYVSHTHSMYPTHQARHDCASYYLKSHPKWYDSIVYGSFAAFYDSLVTYHASLPGFHQGTHDAPGGGQFWGEIF